MLEEKNKNIKSDPEIENKTEIKISKQVSGLSVFIYKYFKIIILIEVIFVLIIGYFLIIAHRFFKLRSMKN